MSELSVTPARRLAVRHSERVLLRAVDALDTARAEAVRLRMASPDHDTAEQVAADAAYTNASHDHYNAWTDYTHKLKALRQAVINARPDAANLAAWDREWSLAHRSAGGQTDTAYRLAKLHQMTTTTEETR